MKDLPAAIDRVAAIVAISELQRILLEINKLPGFSVETGTMNADGNTFAGIAIHGCIVKNGHITLKESAK